MKGRTSGEVKVATVVVPVGTRNRPPVRLDTVVISIVTAEESTPVDSTAATAGLVVPPDVRPSGGVGLTSDA